MPRPKANPDLPNAPGTALLLALARHHALTSQQAAILCFFTRTTPSYTYAHEHLLRLMRHGYIRRQPSTEKGIKDAFLLDERGKRYLAAMGVAVDEKTHHPPPQGLHLAHRLAVTSLLIQLERTGYPILERRNEWQLSRTAVPLTLPSGEKIHYAPDAWVRMLIEGTEYSIAIELDRGTEDQKPWRRKVQEMVTFTTADAKGVYPFTRLFGVERLRFMIVAAPGAIGTVPPELRANNLHHWTELELRKLGMETWQRMFFIRPLDALAMDKERHLLVEPRSILFDRAWCQPFSQEYVPLIGGQS